MDILMADMATPTTTIPMDTIIMVTTPMGIMTMLTLTLSALGPPRSYRVWRGEVEERGRGEG
jgi:hypothetical protein